MAQLKWTGVLSEDQIDICHCFSRAGVFRSGTPNAFEDLLAADKLFALENMLKNC